MWRSGVWSSAKPPTGRAMANGGDRPMPAGVDRGLQGLPKRLCGLSVGKCKDCTVRHCDLSYNGNTGMGMGDCQDCLVEGCTLLFNNYRRFHSGWHCGGIKCIPSNTRCTIRDCEAAYNIASDGIWFDYDNGDIRILRQCLPP